MIFHVVNSYVIRVKPYKPEGVAIASTSVCLSFQTFNGSRSSVEVWTLIMDALCTLQVLIGPSGVQGSQQEKTEKQIQRIIKLISKD